MKIVFIVLAIVLAVSGALTLFGGAPEEAPMEEAAFGEGAGVVDDAGDGFAAEEEEPVGPEKLYTADGHLNCGYFWDDLRAACPEVKETAWNSRDPWDINALPETCKMQSLPGDEGEFLVNVSRSESASAAESVFVSGKAGFATIGYKTIDVTGLGEKAYTVPDPYADVQTGYNFSVKKGIWLVDITSSNPAFCATEAQTRDVVTRILRKLP